MTYAAGLPIVEFSGVHLRLGDTEVLRGIDLTIGCGERVAIIGPSGSGKSSLLRCINGLVRPGAGAVRVFGEDISSPAALQSIRLRTEMIFQSFNLYSNRTALGNVMLAPERLLGMPRAAAEKLAREQLEAVGIGHLAHAYPFELSGGQQQRVALARAFAKSPELMLFDEPTSALDPELVQGVLGLIEAATTKGITTVTVTHELGFARRQAQRMLFMCEGRILEDGAPADLLDRPRNERLKALLQHRLTAVRPPAAPRAVPA